MKKKGYLGEWCKWGTCMNLNEWKGPIFDVKRDRNDEKSRKKIHEND
jgi:hypothetical protein